MQCSSAPVLPVLCCWFFLSWLLAVVGLLVGMGVDFMV